MIFLKTDYTNGKSAFNSNLKGLGSLIGYIILIGSGIWGVTCSQFAIKQYDAGPGA